MITPGKKSDSTGHSLIELIVVMVLMAILAAVAFLGILRSIDIYNDSTRNYISVFAEGKVALEKMIREIRETIPGNPTIVSGDSVTFTKFTGHDTPEDGSLDVTFSLSDDKIQRTTASGTYTLVENVSEFNPSVDGNNVVTIDFTLSKGGNSVRLRSALYPRQED